MATAYRIEYDSYLSYIEEADDEFHGDTFPTFTVAKKELVDYLARGKDDFAFALKIARTLKKEDV